MKRLALMVGTGLLLGTGSVHAAEATANVAIATDYVYRGISQTNENPAIQGGFDLAGESGLYIGVWGSNVGFDGSIELDLYAGYSGSFSDTVSYDVGILRYEYPDDEGSGAPVCDNLGDTDPDTNKYCESSFTEYYFSVAIADLTLGINHSPDFFYNTDMGTYFYADYSMGLPSDMNVDFHFGVQSIDDNSRLDLPDYTDYSISIGRRIVGLDFALTWYDTDLSESECFSGSSTCESRVALSVAKSL